MKSLREYIAESEQAWSKPVPGDYFAINIREETLFETWVCDETPDGIVIYADSTGMQLLEDYGYLGEAISEGHDFDIDSEEDDVDVVDQGEYDQEGDMAKDDLATIVRAARRLTGMLDDDENLPEWVQSKINKAADYVDTAADYIESNKERAVDEGVWDNIKKVFAPRDDKSMPDDETSDYQRMGQQAKQQAQGRRGIHNQDSLSSHEHMRGSTYDMSESDMDEAKYQGREVPLGKPMKGDVKKSKVYVRGPKGNVVKVNFGQKGMKIKKNIPGRRKNFRARHNCDNPGPRWKARYWSCRAW